jgi:colanic acid/amylovoran biosynthesis protein
MSKILIINHYSTNKGDAALLICMIDALRKYIPDAKFSVSSSYPEVTIGQPEVKALEWIIGGRGDKRSAFQRSILSKILSLLKILLLVLQSLIWVVLKRYTGKDVNLLISTNKRELLREYADADIVICCAGGHLNSYHGIGSYFQFYAILLAIILGKNTMIYAQSIGPFDNKLRTIIYKLMIRLFINKVDLITLRESVSKKVLHDLEVVKPPTYVTADAAFLLRSEKPERIKGILHAEGISSISRGEKHPLVGITLLHWGYSGSTKREIKHAEYKKAIAQVADYLISQLNAEVVFIPMEASLLGDDRPLALEIRQMMKYKDNANVIIGEYTPEELKGITGQMDIVIGSRLLTKSKQEL